MKIFQLISMRTNLIKECNKIQENCTYTAEAHHIIAEDNKKKAMFFQVVPAAIAALSALLTVGQIIDAWWGWVTVISAVIAAVGNAINPLNEYHHHLNAAKNFTTLKHDARILHEVYCKEMKDSELSIAVRTLHDRYNDLVRFAPATEEKAFEKARLRIKSRVHESDDKNLS